MDWRTQPRSSPWQVERRSAAQTEVVAYLHCHGITAIPRVVAPTCDRSAICCLLAVAEEGDASLLVMGAYSHSRMREMLLGGVTRGVLKNAVARTVLLAR